MFNYYGYASGGGAADCTLNNCTLTGNAACGYYYGGSSEEAGGGAYNSTLHNCILYFNTANDGANYDSGSVLDYCLPRPWLRGPAISPTIPNWPMART